MRGERHPFAGSQTTERFIKGQTDITRLCTAGPRLSEASLEGSCGRCSRREGRWLTLVAVKTMMCCTSLQVRHGRTCSIRAIIPAASGAAADVPVWPSVHPVPFCKSQSVVTFRDRGEMPPITPIFATLLWLGWEWEQMSRALVPPVSWQPTLSLRHSH